MAAWTSLARLLGAGWALARADALLPRELHEALPPSGRWAARAVRLASGREARLGRPGERLARVLEGQGPVAIKLGQFLATRGDIVGVAFAEDLGRLKDNLTPFPTSLARAEVEAALGRPLGEVYAAFGEAVAGASLAQVHRATFRDGRDVAVKVLRPGIERRVAADIAALAWAARLVHAVSPAARRLEPRAFAATIARALRLELDLRFEAAGADELRQAMAADDHMSAPRVIWEGVERRVLTLEWAEGLPLSGAAALAQPGLDRPRAAANLIRGFLAQALDHGVFHADLHEGNLFLTAAGGVVAVDFGIVGRLGVMERRFLAEMLWGFLRRDYARVAAIHFEAGYVPARHDPAAFAQALRAVGEPVIGRVARDVSMGRLLTLLFEVTALFDMRLRPELILLQKTMVTVEGVARRVDPDLDIWVAAEPIVQRWILRELSPATRARRWLGEARTVGAAFARSAARLGAEVEVEVEADAPPSLRRRWPERSGWFVAGAAVAALAWAVLSAPR